MKTIEKNGQKYSIDLFTYQAKVAQINANGQVVININIESEADFVWERTTYSLTGNQTQTRDTVQIPALAVEIRDSGSGRNLQDQPVQITDMAGSAELPYVLSSERIFKANSTINVIFTNTQATDQYQGLTLAFHGYKIWKLG